MFYQYESKKSQEYIQQRLESRWSQWLSKRMPPSRKLTLNQKRVFILPTGMGAGYLLTTFLLFIAGVNYNNSLVLSLSFLLGSLFVVTILQTFSNLSGLIITAGKTQSSFAGKECLFEVGLSRSPNKKHFSVRCKWHNYFSAPQNLNKNEQVNVKMLLPTQKRGLFRPKRLKIQSDYPLGLCRAWTWVDLDMTCLIYPKPIPLESNSAATLKGYDGNAISPDSNDDFEGLRNYQTGDSLKTVDWKAFARQGHLLTKVYHGYQSNSLWISWNDFPGNSVEQKLSYMCFLVTEYSRTHLEYGLKLPNHIVEPNSGKNHERVCLEALARFQL